MNALDYLSTPCGTLEITASEYGIKSIVFVDNSERTITSNALTDAVKQQLQEYFQGKRDIFDVPLSPEGTDFQKQVWRALLKIELGETASYLDIASAIGNTKACRAVGAANGRNPIAIIVPCHRIIGSNGKLTGYAGGLHRKKWLLDHEQCTAYIQ